MEIGDKVVVFNSEGKQMCYPVSSSTIGDKVVITPGLGGKMIALKGGVSVQTDPDLAIFYCDPSHYTIEDLCHAHNYLGECIGTYLCQVVCHNTNDVHIWLGRDNYPSFGVSATVTFSCNPSKQAKSVALTFDPAKMSRIEPVYDNDPYSGTISGYLRGISVATGLPVGTPNSAPYPPNTPGIVNVVWDLGEVCNHITLEILVISKEYYPSYYPDPNTLSCCATIEGITFSK